jgi:hypothetical protein
LSVSWAEAGFLLPRLSLYLFASLFPISLTHWTSAADLTAVSWTPNQRLVDILGCFLMVGPLVTLLPIAVLGGRYADQESFDKAHAFFKVQETFAGIWLIACDIVLVFFWRKLIAALRIRESHISLQSDAIRIKRMTSNVSMVIMNFWSWPNV